MNLPGHERGGRPQRRVAWPVFLAMVSALAIAVLAPASALAAEPSISSVTPAGGPLAGGTSVEVKGAHFTGATEVKFGATNATGFTLVSGSRITATSPAGTGVVDVTVKTPGGTNATSVADRFTYGPNVTGVSPNRGVANGGTSVTVTGSDFSAATAVKFGSSNATSFKVNSQSSITAVSPEGVGTVDVTVSDPEATSPISPADQFTFVPPPTVTSVTPAGGPEAGGTEVTITATGTNANEVTAVDFGMSPASFFANNEGSITAFSPSGAGVVDVTVTAFGGTSLTSFADQFSYAPPPTLTGISPETGAAAGGTPVTITGANFEEGAAVHFGSASATSVVVNSESSITAVSPIGTPGESVAVTVTTFGGTTPTSEADRFRYLQTAPLHVGKVTPNSGPLIGGTAVTIGGGAFVGATAVRFGSASAASFVVKGEHAIEARAPAGAGTVDVTVTTPEGTSPTSPADQFSYVASPPIVDAVSPSEGHERGGMRVKITGTGFIGAAEVRFGSAPATSIVVNRKGTEISVVDPAAEAVGQATVDITVISPEGTSPLTPADRFTYLIPPPIISGLSTHKGPAGGGTTVTISGEHFVGVTAVDFGSVGATSFVVNSSKVITAISPAETSDKVNVTATTPAGLSGPGECVIFTEEGPERVPCIPRDHFIFEAPTITSITPNNGSTAGGTTVEITGTGFGVGTSTTAFHFGGTPQATSVDCTSSTRCTLVSPTHAAGTIDVKAKVLESSAAGESHLDPPADQFTYN
jgi:IPT/TIG domain